MDYFIESSAYVRWNEKGYFNIIDGHHRASYLAYKGYQLIPVRMDKGDFLKWENKGGINKLEDFSAVLCPIPLPAYLNEEVIYEPQWKKVIDFYYSVLISQGKTGLKFIEADANLGYYARYFNRADWFQTYVLTQNQEESEKCSLINSMLWQNIEVSPSIDIEGQVAYIDLDLFEYELFDRLLQNSDFICFVFVVKDKSKDKVISQVQTALNSSVQLLFSYQDWEKRRIYGITRC